MPKRFLSSLACGYILMFYSEHMFWAHVRPNDNLLDYMATWIMYSILAVAFQLVVDYFRVKSIWALFLAGAVFGWLTEGIVVQTTYESLPFSISFTGLSWHALISVWVGWYAVRKAIQSGVGATLKVATAIGIFYGLWAIYWWNEPNEIAATPLAFALFAGMTTLLLIVSYMIYDRNMTTFTGGRKLPIIIGVILLLYFVLIAIPTVPIAAVVLPPLLLIVYVVLRRNRRLEAQDGSLMTLTEAPPLKNYLAVLAIPIIAVMIYSVAFSQGWQWYTNWVVYLITMPLGFLLFGISILKVWRRKPVVH